MWRWISEYCEDSFLEDISVSEIKEKYFEGKDRIPLNYCYLCDYAGIEHDMRSKCDSCPIDWGEYGVCQCIPSLYRSFVYAKNNKERANFAKIISNLPEKE